MRHFEGEAQLRVDEALAAREALLGRIAVNHAVNFAQIDVAAFHGVFRRAGSAGFGHRALHAIQRARMARHDVGLVDGTGRQAGELRFELRLRA